MELDKQHWSRLTRSELKLKPLPVLQRQREEEWESLRMEEA